MDKILFSKCKSRMLQGYIFVLCGDGLYGRKGKSSIELSSKKEESGRLFTMLNLYSNTPSGNAWLKENFTKAEQQKFFDTIEYFKSIVD